MKKEFIRKYTKIKKITRLYLGMQMIERTPVYMIFLLAVSAITIGCIYVFRTIFYAISTEFPFKEVLGLCFTILIGITGLLCELDVVMRMGDRVAKPLEAACVMAFDARDVRIHPPILISKKINNFTGVNIVEFYSMIPLNKWEEKKQVLQDLLNMRVIPPGILYGGPQNDCGNRIRFYMIGPRVPKDRGVLYDDYI